MYRRDKEKIARLSDVFDRNFKITRLYASYLERFPEAITKEMIDTVCEGGDITPEAALVGILSELFGLDIDRAEDRRLILDYLTPSVRLFDARKYYENPYYKNIRIENVKEEGWELRQESYLPYRGVIAGDMQIYPDYREVPPLGFFTEEFRFPAVLENGNEWMTLTPVDLDTSEEAIEAAEGDVVTFGLGLGYYAYMCSEKSEVKTVTVVEKSRDVIALFEKHILPQFPNKSKVIIVNADAFDFAERVMPEKHYNVAFVDTWRDASDGAPMYKRMKALEPLSPDTRFLYWIENFLISRHRALAWWEMTDKLEAGTEDAPRSFADITARLDNPL